MVFNIISQKPFNYWCGAGIEPAQPQVPRDFKTKTDERRVASQPPVFLFKYLLRLNKLKNS
jgi:hypothetical protein